MSFRQLFSMVLLCQLGVSATAFCEVNLNEFAAVMLSARTNGCLFNHHMPEVANVEEKLDSNGKKMWVVTGPHPNKQYTGYQMTFYQDKQCTWEIW